MPNGVDRGGGFGEIMCSGWMGRARRRRLYEEDHEAPDHPVDHLSDGKIPGSRRPRTRGSFFQKNHHQVSKKTDKEEEVREGVKRKINN